MHLRKIKLGSLGLSGAVYRVHVVLVQSLFFYALTGEWKWAIGASLAWGLINTFLYYNYHYWFARLFKIGVEE